MKITKWLKDSNDNISKVEWTIIRTSDDDSRGYTLEGIKGRWLTVVSTFVEDANTNILSVNPFNHPALSKYTELSDEEVADIQDKKRANEEAERLLQAKENTLRALQHKVDTLEKDVYRKEKILSAVKNNIIYDGDLELMTALHSFTETSLDEERVLLSNAKLELQGLQSDNG